MTFSNFFSDYLGNLEWLDVIIGGVLLFVLAWIWYQPLFGKMWSKATGIEMGGNPDPKIMGMGFVKFFLFGLGINLVFPAIHVAFGNAPTFETLLVTAFAVSFLISGMALASRVVWERGSWNLWLIDWGFWFVGSFAYGYVVLDLLA